MNACVWLNTYNRVREHMTCDVIFVIAILKIVFIYTVYFLCNTNVLEHEIKLQISSFSEEYKR